MNLSLSNRQIATVIRFKSIIFPFLAVFFAILLSIVPDWQTWWLGISRDRIYNDPQCFVWVIIGIIGGSIGIGILSWFLGRLMILRYRIQRSMVSFIVAYDRRHWFGLIIVYPMTLLYEELLFRAFGMILCIRILSFLPPTLNILCSILLNAIVFSVYHLHIYITTKNGALTVFYMVVSFFLGLLTAGSVLTIGVLGCWVIHLIIVTIIYLFWARTTRLIAFPNFDEKK